MNGGTIGVSTSGDRFESGSFSSSPKGLSATENIFLNGGNIIVMATGSSDGAKAIESDGNVILAGGIIEAYSYDDAINAQKFTMSGGSVSANSINGDGIRGKELVAISSETITACAGTQSSGISCNSSDLFRINGGEIFALGGTVKSLPAYTDLCGVYENITISKGSFFNLIGEDNNVIISFKAPRTYIDATVLVASDSLYKNSVVSTTITNL